jgi:Ser/Thr protein kinase RdoA (MazF antagonist)
MDIWGNTSTKHFFNLDYNTVLNEVERFGYKTTGRCLALNSMENRVYEIELDDDSFIVCKFYRPGRWSKDTLLDEHRLTLELQENEIPIIAPLTIYGETLLETTDGIFFCIFPKKSGRLDPELSESKLQVIGRSLGRMHNIGEKSPSKNRITLNEKSYGLNNLNYLITNDVILKNFQQRYDKVVRDLINLGEDLFKNINNIRIHGDWRDDTPLIVDFDDTMNGPMIQDFWLLFPIDNLEFAREKEILINSYEQFREFDDSQLKLCPILRALRIVHFSAWIARRWEDNSFKKNFPQFGSEQYWNEQVSTLYEIYESITHKLY